MNPALFLELLNAVWREILASKIKLMLLGVCISFVVLVMGYFTAEQYQTSATLYADNTNIIKPLLEGRAKFTDIDRSKQAADKIYTRKILTKVAESAGLLDPVDDPGRQNSIITTLRNTISVESQGKNFFRISYSNEDQDLSFKVLNAVVDQFISDSVATRRMESRSAYEFIDQQVVEYKSQLIEAERNLKEYKANNLDGDEGSVRNRIEEIRREIEEITLRIEEGQAKEGSLLRQLKSEGEMQLGRSELQTQTDRLESLRSQLDTLRLTYQETYPDVVALKEQVAAVELVVDAMREIGGDLSGFSGQPLYGELRKNLAEVQVQLQSLNRRKSSMEKILEKEYARAERVASQEADQSELIRDYDVTRDIYEKMLERKERARLSMTLDVEGQGVSYKIQEPAIYPLAPSGLRFVHFAMAGPLVGLLATLGLMVLYVLVDPRVRSPLLLVQSLPEKFELLGVIPHINSPVVSRLQKSDMLIMILGSMVFLSIYITLVVWNVDGGL